MSERALLFSCGSERLVGVLHPGDRRDVGVVLVVGGPQYRVGSHRQFVLLARALARAGFPVLRFDYRGMGDSDGAPRTFEDVEEDIRAAIDCLLREAPHLRGVVLWGLCDGASASLMYAPSDPRVLGLVLLNPWARTEAGIAEAYVKHYYVRRLADRDFWRSLFTGRVRVFGSLCEFVRNLLIARRAGSASAHERLDFTERMRHGAQAFRGPLLLVISGRDLTASEFEAYCARTAGWDEVLRRPATRRMFLADADHTFSTGAWRRQVEEWTCSWLEEVFARGVPQTRISAGGG